MNFFQNKIRHCEEPRSGDEAISNTVWSANFD